MAKIAVSACLLGHCCKYNGGHNKNQDVLDFLQDQGAEILPVCPETAGGLPRPRPPAEIQPDGRVVDNTGTDVTAAFQAGAGHGSGLQQRSAEGQKSLLRCGTDL